MLPLSRLIPDSRRKVSWNYKLKHFVSEAHSDWRRAHYGWRLLFPDRDRLALSGGAIGHDPFTEYRSYFDDVPHATELNQCLYVDVKTWLANDILVKVDKASMAVGLEARVPFLDIGLLEYSMSLPARMKMRGLSGKFVLRRAMQGRLPEAVLRRRKSGFNAPVSDWLRGSLRPVVETLLRTPSTVVDVEHPVLQDTWLRHQTGRADNGFRLWALVVLLIWEREVLHGSAEEKGSAMAGWRSA
jgi:asparagine synthase (glutamine-hydrolysing)